MWKNTIFRSSAEDSDTGSDTSTPPPPLPATDRPTRQGDIWIALVGVTGSGKSTFISHCVDEPVQVGHSLKSCTEEVALYSFIHETGVKVNLVDTPGFDDDNMSDLEVLRILASWLGMAYENKIRLNGIIYLHRITDVRMQGSGGRNLKIFQAMCGLEALSNVTLATTRWEEIAEDLGTRRERELEETPDYWGWMKQNGSRIERHYDNRDSALRLIDIYLDFPRRVSLEIQEELVVRKQQLEQTSAGREVAKDLLRQRNAALGKLATAEKLMPETHDHAIMLELERNKTEVDQQIRLLEEKRRELFAGLERYKARGNMKQAFDAAAQNASEETGAADWRAVARPIGDSVINGIWILSNCKISFSESPEHLLTINGRTPRNRNGEGCPFGLCVKTEMGPTTLGFIPKAFSIVPSMRFCGGGIITIWSGFDQAFIQSCREVSKNGYSTTHWVEAMNEPAKIVQDGSGRVRLVQTGASYNGVVG
ncbi:P-loop containing nucleoside triphosphate hydrolase protein [Chaetomium sp. MPI-CAGE-AT-0009]|nr:P-loop containing nucleoside triphosphate hydrolase protein [Chaetomium sp. MPI-CAGE-AT-0009]